jgi:hypothetical protein
MNFITRFDLCGSTARTFEQVKNKKLIMKMKSLVLTTLVVLGSAMAFGKEDPKTGLAILPVKGSETFRIIYKGENTARVKLNIYNADGAQILTQTISGLDGFIIPVNFRGVEAGNYTVEISDGSVKQIANIAYQPKQNQRHMHVTRLVDDHSKFLVSVPNKGEELIDLNIYDTNGNLLHHERAAINGDFAKVYKLNATSKYTFEVIDAAGNTKSVRF